MYFMFLRRKESPAKHLLRTFAMWAFQFRSLSTMTPRYLTWSCCVISSPLIVTDTLAGHLLLGLRTKRLVLETFILRPFLRRKRRNNFTIEAGILYYKKCATRGEEPWIGLPTKKSKVLRFQICCARTKHLSEIYKNRTIKVAAAKLYFQSIHLGLERVTKNWAQFGSSDFWSFAMKLVVLMDCTWCILCKNAWTAQGYSCQEIILAVILCCNTFLP